MVPKINENPGAAIFAITSIKNIAKSDLAVVISGCEDPERVVSGLLYILGFSSVLREKKVNGVSFSASSQGIEQENIVFMNTDLTLEGDFVPELEKCTKAIYILECEADRAIILPQPLREERFRQLCESVGITDEYAVAIAKRL